MKHTEAEYRCTRRDNSIMETWHMACENEYIPDKKSNSCHNRGIEFCQRHQRGFADLQSVSARQIFVMMLALHLGIKALVHFQLSSAFSRAFSGYWRLLICSRRPCVYSTVTIKTTPVTSSSTSPTRKFIQVHSLSTISHWYLVLGNNTTPIPTIYVLGVTVRWI